MKIVVIDDSSTMGIVLDSFINNFTDRMHEVVMFQNGYEALDHIKMYGANIVFSDVQMPYMEGCEFPSLVLAVKPDLKCSFFAINVSRNCENCEIFMEIIKSGFHKLYKKPQNGELFNNPVDPEIVRCRMMETYLSCS